MPCVHVVLRAARAPIQCQLTRICSSGVCAKCWFTYQSTTQQMEEKQGVCFVTCPVHHDQLEWAVPGGAFAFRFCFCLLTCLCSVAERARVGGRACAHRATRGASHRAACCGCGGVAPV